MLVLAFHVGKDRFALRCADVVEVVPRVNLREIPHAPPYVAGMFTYRGRVVPVVDLCKLMWGTPCPERLSSRIMLAKYPASPTRTRTIGLLAERVTEAITLDETAAVPPGLNLPDAPYLGEIYFDEQGRMIQLVRLDALFPATYREMLTAGDEELPA
jgi:chemotaxis-related protein WspB